VNAVGEANSTIRILGGTQLQEQVVIDGTLAPNTRASRARPPSA
jgi:hypothetical protein